MTCSNPNPPSTASNPCAKNSRPGTRKKKNRFSTFTLSRYSGRGQGEGSAFDVRFSTLLVPLAACCQCLLRRHFPSMFWTTRQRLALSLLILLILTYLLLRYQFAPTRIDNPQPL